MNSDLLALIAEIKSWLASQAGDAPGSERWYVLNNVRAFLTDLEASRSTEAVARAVKVLQRQIADQFDWESEYCQIVSTFAARAHRIERELSWTQRGEA
jgi:hypothetical protein